MKRKLTILDNLGGGWSCARVVHLLMLIMKSFEN